MTQLLCRHFLHSIIAYLYRWKLSISNVCVFFLLGDERVYLIVKAVVRLSHPAAMDLVLRKRLAVNIYKKQSLTSKFVKSIIGSVNTMYETGIMYEVVSNIPKVILSLFSYCNILHFISASNLLE